MTCLRVSQYYTSVRVNAYHDTPISVLAHEAVRGEIKSKEPQSWYKVWGAREFLYLIWGPADQAKEDVEEG
eukprot:1342721-Rhodomonas_salina.5